MQTVTLPFSENHPAFAGHFPGQPIVPGVLLLAWAQVAIELMLGHAIQVLNEAKFHSPATPADTLTLEFEIGTLSVRFEIHNTDMRKIASGRFGLAATALP